jgi:hypothetical protein
MGLGPTGTTIDFLHNFYMQSGEYIYRCRKEQRERVNSSLVKEKVNEEMQPIILAPVDSSEAGQIIQPGENVIYSATAWRSTMAAPTGNTHFVITDRAIYYNTKTKGPLRVPWFNVWRFGYMYYVNPVMQMDNGESLTMVLDKSTGEDKDASKMRFRTFFADVLPFGIAAIQAEMQNLEGSGAKRDVKKLERKLKVFIKWQQKGEKEKAKYLKKVGQA